MVDEHDDELLLDTPLEDEREGEAGETDDISIEIEGDEPVEETPLVKTLRQRERDLARENAELKRNQQTKAPIVVGDKPTLEGCDWDAEAFENKLDAWKERSRAAKEQIENDERQTQARNHSFERSMSSYRDQAARLGVRDFADAETAVKEALPEVVQSAIITYFKEPAKLIAALGKSPLRLASIAAEPDAMKQLFMLKDMEGSIKVINRRKPPEPEADTIQRGSSPLSSADPAKKLAELEKEADRTGDRSKIIAFKRAQKEKAK